MNGFQRLKTIYYNVISIWVYMYVLYVYYTIEA